ncbi:MAG: NAD/FAD-binding protein, partial [Hyphomicrobiaceae bacterium]|nr:NAD/FAD-binding protein [Hyphomicrobiaceae bacterium]
YFVSLNPMVPLAARHVIRTMSYAHPLFDQAAMRAQKRLWVLQGRRRTWFCGSYFGAGFHEDGLQAGLAVAEALGGVERPWQVAAPSGRIHVLSGATRPVVAEEVV